MRSWRKIWKLIGFLRPFARLHTKWLVRGVLATVAIVLLRLALPWPLKGVIDALTNAKQPSFVPSWGDPVAWFVSAFVVLALGVALTEMIQRVCMAKFATHTFHDLRAAAVRGAGRVAVTAERRSPGDLIARIIGDTARVKESSKGILIHATQHGLFYIGVTVVFMFISPILSVFFLLGGLIATLVGVRVSTNVASAFKEQRQKEGALAKALHQRLEHDALGELEDLNESSASKDVRVTKLVSMASVIVHVALAGTTAAAVWFGARLLSPGELFLFITYALLAHHRIVQVGRQLARGGKVIACARRLRTLIDKDVPAPVAPSRPLASALRLEGAALDAPRRRPRIDELTLSVTSGAKIAVVGGIGSGKSSLLRLLAGAERADRGRIVWDDEEVTPEALTARVNYLPQEPFIPRARAWTVLGLPAPEAPSDEVVATLKGIGAWKIIAGMAKGLRQRVGSETLSRNEARVLKLGGVLFAGAAPLWLLDSPCQGLSLARSRMCIDEILKRAGSRTVIVALSRAVDVERFDRLIALKEGKIAFDGQPREWKERKLLKE